ncbi:MAG: metal-dependent hydrolase [Bacteroidaceae bacterium]|nr:metal-dependent hydrolase [Bacteroidaceae bacterium]
MARFLLQDSPLVEAAGGRTDWTKVTVTVNGKEYIPAVQEDGKVYVDVEDSEAAVYEAVLVTEETTKYHGDTPLEDVVHPFAYAYHTLGNTLTVLPKYASYDEEKGNLLSFSSGLSMIGLTVQGMTSISSIKVTDPQGTILGGTGSYDPQTRSFKMEKGLPFMVLNCTNRGAFVSSSGNVFMIPVRSGQYSKGLEVTICSADHLMCRTSIPSFTVDKDKVHSCMVTWKPDKNLLFYEGFDNMVWGGDVVAGEDSFGMNPVAGDMTIKSGRTLRGYETPLYPVSYEMAGAGYIQESNLSVTEGKDVSGSRYLSDSYIKSRNIGGYLRLYRCQEYQGYISVGDTYNGIVEPVFAGEISDAHRDIVISFDICAASDFDDDLSFKATNGGNIISCMVDGTELPETVFSRKFSKTGSTAALDRSAVTLPASDGRWHNVELTVRNMNDKSTFTLTTAASHSKPGAYRFYLDNYQVRTLKDHADRDGSTLRVMCWNIQNGMWADQDNNYNNFVAWVKKYNPDVCVWCEGETIFNTSGDKVYGTNRILPNAWASVAQRYGHNYWSKSEDRDNYPQIITSKYPINTLAKIGQIGTTDAYVEHGSGLFEVEFNGHSVYFVSFHAFAHAYDPKYTSSGTDAQNASAALYEGDYHREKEIRYVYEQTIEKYPSQSNWLMMGDFNSISSLDAEHHTGINDTNWLLHDHILGKDYLKDIIAERNAPEDFFSSINGDSRRIDFIYASPAMYDRIESTAIIIDSWTALSQDKSVSDKGYFCRPSDHRPILVDFKMN